MFCFIIPYKLLPRQVSSLKHNLFSLAASLKHSLFSLAAAVALLSAV